MNKYVCLKNVESQTHMPLAGIFSKEKTIKGHPTVPGKPCVKTAGCSGDTRSHLIGKWEFARFHLARRLNSRKRWEPGHLLEGRKPHTSAQRAFHVGKARRGRNEREMKGNERDLNKCEPTPMTSPHNFITFLVPWLASCPLHTLSRSTRLSYFHFS